MFTYAQALQEANNLIDDPGYNPEYERGIHELLARLYGDSVLLTEGDTNAGVARIQQDLSTMRI